MKLNTNWEKLCLPAVALFDKEYLLLQVFIRSSSTAKIQLLKCSEITVHHIILLLRLLCPRL